VSPYRTPPRAAIHARPERTPAEVFELACAAIDHFNRSCPFRLIIEAVTNDSICSRMATKHGPRFYITDGIFSVEFCCQEKWNEMWAGHYLPWIFRWRWKRRMKKLEGGMFRATPPGRPR